MAPSGHPDAHPAATVHLGVTMRSPTAASVDVMARTPRRGGRPAADRVDGAQRVLLHVGLPGAETRSVDAALLTHRKELRETGLLYAGGKDRMRRAAVDVRGSGDDRALEEARGSWDDLCARAREHDGVSVIGHEDLGATSARRITAAMSLLRGLDVHVVLTVRDPARQVVQAWQEGVLRGSALTFAEYHRDVLDHRSQSEAARRFRAAHDLPDVLGRWGRAVPDDHVHVVTCPAPGEPADAAWRRFADLTGVDADRFALPPGSGGPPLGTDGTDLVRRVNLAGGRRTGSPDRPAWPASLGADRSSAPVCPPESYDDLVVVAERWAKEVDRAGCTVHGDLADLVPVASPGRTRHPDYADARAQVDLAAAGIADLLTQLEDQRADNARLADEATRQRKRRKQLKRRLREVTDADEA